VTFDNTQRNEKAGSGSSCGRDAWGFNRGETVRLAATKALSKANWATKELFGGTIEATASGTLKGAMGRIDKQKDSEKGN